MEGVEEEEGRVGEEGEQWRRGRQRGWNTDGRRACRVNQVSAAPG